MPPITSIPARTASDLGLPIVNTRPPRANELPATSVEGIKARIIEGHTAIGLDDGSTSGSLREEIYKAKGSGAAYDGDIVKRTAGAVASLSLRRAGLSTSAPGVGDDETAGYASGSIWEQVSALPPFETPPTRVFWLCVDPNAGAAVWAEIDETGGGASPSDADPLALGTADPGTDPDYARADHVHPSNVSNTVALALGAASAGVSAGVARVDHVHPTNASNTLPLGHGTASAGVASGVSRVDHVHPVQGPSVEEIAITNGVTLAAGDAVALVSGRASKSDARAGSVVAGYVGQCLSGGTGDAGGTVKALVIVAGLAPATGLTPGAPVYLSTATIGVVSSTAPSGLGALYQFVGTALDSTHFVVEVAQPATIDWCSPLDIATNGIFYGRASSANLLASGRITTNGIADLFPASSRVATIDASGNAPAHVSGGAPNGHDAWFFDSARSDRLRIVHDAGMTGVSWTMAVMHFATSAASQRCLVAKCNGSTPSPIDMHIIGVEELRLEGSIGMVSKGWRFDAASRPSSGSNAVYSGSARIGGSAISALSAGTDDILIGLRNDLATPYLGRISGFALWNRQLSAAEHVGLAKWARSEWGV